MNRFIKGLSYTFNRNIGYSDRLIRVFAALVLIYCWYMDIVTGIIGTVVGVFSIMILGTAASARCGVTYWFDGNTMSEEEKKRLDSRGIRYE